MQEELQYPYNDPYFYIPVNKCMIRNTAITNDMFRYSDNNFISYLGHREFFFVFMPKRELDE